MKLQREFILDPTLALYTLLWKRDGATFMSDDQRGHLCTVTGATWGLQGRTFDGTDDVITIPTATSLDPGTGSFSVLVWAKCTDVNCATADGDGRCIYTKEKATDPWNGFSLFLTQATGTLHVYTRDASGNGVDTVGTGSVADNTFHLYGATIKPGSTTGAKLYLDGAPHTISSGANLSTIVDTLSTTASIRIGVFRAGTGFFKGIGGDVIYAPRILTAGEIALFYQKTKWRYR